VFNSPDRSRWTHFGRVSQLAAALLIQLAAACGGDTGSRDQDASSDDPRKMLTESDFGGLDSTGIGLILPWSGNKVSKDPDPDAEPVPLTAVATETHAEYDRMVFTFENRIPTGYRLAFVAEGGGGCDGTEPVEGGSAHLAVEFDRAFSNEAGEPLVEDRDRRTRFPALLGATQVCDDGNKVRWLLATRTETEFRIFEMVTKPRLVLDLRHP